MRAQVSRAGAASRRRVSTSVSARPLGWRLAALVATDFAVCPRLFGLLTADILPRNWSKSTDFLVIALKSPYNITDREVEHNDI